MHGKEKSGGRAEGGIHKEERGNGAVVTISVDKAVARATYDPYIFMYVYFNPVDSIFDTHARMWLSVGLRWRHIVLLRDSP